MVGISLLAERAGIGCVPVLTGGMKGENNIMNIGYILVLILDVVTGVASTLYLLVSLFVVLGQKIYGKVKYGKSLYD